MRNPPIDLNEPYYYPETWNEGMPPAKYNASQICNWQINVPDGMYATVIFYSYATDIRIYCSYPNGKQEVLTNNDTSPYIFTSPQFQIDFQAKSNEGIFSFKVLWSRYNDKICQNTVEMNNNDLFPVYPTDCITTFTTPNKALLVGFWLQGILLKSLRLSAVYEGDSINGAYLGNLLDAYNDNIQSEGKQMTVYTFGLLNQINRTLFLGMDVEAAGDIEKFHGQDCTEFPSHRCDILINSQTEVNAVITSSRDVDYLKVFTQLGDHGTLTIYEGKIDEEHLLATVDQSNFYYMFPMAVKNSIKIYKLNKGTITLPLERKPGDVAYSTVYVTRHVNIHSFDIGEITYYQDTIENFTTGSTNLLMNFNFVVKYFNVNGPTTTLEITILRGSNTVYYEKVFRREYATWNSFQIFGRFHVSELPDIWNLYKRI